MNTTFIRLTFVIFIITIVYAVNVNAPTRKLHARESPKHATVAKENLIENQKLSTTEDFHSTDSFDYDEGDYDNEGDDDGDGDTAEGATDAEDITERPTGNRRNKKGKKYVGISYFWGRWEKWSRCTTSCVQTRRRVCVKRILNSTQSEPEDISFYPDPKLNQTGCLGLTKKFRLCKDDRCSDPHTVEMLNDQCSQFNRIIIRGRYYKWEAAQDDHNECVLHCKVKDSDMVMNMNKWVTDGTPCHKPSIYYTHSYRRKAVCVEGICKAVHSTGAIRPSTTKDTEERCGSVLCQKVNEIFSQTKLSNGYNYITTIPAGAMNLTIHAMAKSNNLIALKTKDDKYIVNGNNRPSEGGFFEYNDDTFDYNKEAGMIKAKGPLNSPIVLMLLVSELNPGIQYSYMLPVPSATITEPEEIQSQWNELGQPLDEIDENSVKTPYEARARERRKRKYAWELLGFGPCSRTCGPGKQSPIFRCTRETDSKETVKRYYSPKRCANLEKETFLPTIYLCSHGLCPAYWKQGDFGDCECSSGSTEGYKHREVLCYQENINGTHVQVEERKCSDIKPAAKERCNCKKPKLYTRNVEKSSQMYARVIGSPTTIRNIMSKRHTHSNTSISTSLKRNYREDKAGVWLMSDWNKQCSRDCIYSYEHRTIHCDRTAPYVDPCDPVTQPEAKRSCTSHSKTCRRGMWFASEWSKCAGDCMNRRRTRMVLCVVEGFVVDIKQCDPKTKPIEATICATKDNVFCGPKWHYSEWSECSRSCGEGVQRRYAKCLEFDWKLKEMTESNKCKYLEREPVYGTCNMANCEELRVAAHNAASLTPSAAANGADNAIAVHTKGNAAAAADSLQGLGDGIERYEYEYEGDELVETTADVDADADDAGIDEYIYQDLSGGNEKIVIASAPKVLQNCREELNNCKRINRERLCKVDYYKKYCCLTCHGYY
ncbi:thrombospondin type-1 domain-containing protein 4-like [Haematobia irritans]|uniref:thrombospondin type-1 domain-containing protein 4-like n=1 Tax=Haematobia irritans TaxID=7368 RepID=UPI003F4F691C